MVLSVLFHALNGNGKNSETILLQPISYDAEGAKTIFPVYKDVAAMRASGQSLRRRSKILLQKEVKNGIYKRPSRTGGFIYAGRLSMRVYPTTPDNKIAITMSMPHYMFYAPYITYSDVGIKPDAQEGLMMVNPGEWYWGKEKDLMVILLLQQTKPKKLRS
jgi:hypothetical protein